MSTLNIKLSDNVPDSVPGDAVAVCVFEDDPRLGIGTDTRTLETVDGLKLDGEFRGEAGTSQILHATISNGHGPRRLLLLGLGTYEDFDTKTFNRAAAMAVRRAVESHVKHLHFIMPPSARKRLTTRAIVEGAYLGLYDNAFYQKPENHTTLETLTLVSSEDGSDLRKEIERGRIVAEAVNWTRRLADEPGATLPPREFARQAAVMAEEFNLSIETLDAEEVRARGMGGLWAVGKGSNQPPVLIVVRYEPDGASDKDELWAFVGKGITFDTGGISIKHGLEMYEMKSDMAGGAAVLGAMRAIAQLKPERRVVAIVPAAENMPSGKAIKPGDVITTLAGYTIEVVDTDAEGRLVLADGIAFAKQLGSSRIVDVATLTGSIIVALGDDRAGLFSNDDSWASQVEAAAQRAGEPAWRMPICDDYKKRIESPIADFKNYGGRPDATAAGLLLSKFAGDTPWVHLDIAGTAWNDEVQPHAPKGSTGAGVRTLTELVCESE